MTMHRRLHHDRSDTRIGLVAAALCAGLLLVVPITGCTTAAEQTSEQESAAPSRGPQVAEATASGAAPAVPAAVDEDRNGDEAGDDEDAAPEEGQLAGQWGIEITSVRLTANDHMIDFRYRVVDAEKAKELFVRENKPALIHQESGKVLVVPATAKVGPLRNSDTPKEGKIYWMFFGNAGMLVKPGDKATVVIGEFRAENLTVE